MLMVVPGADSVPWPSLGKGICDLIEERGIYGPGSLQGQPYRLDPEFRAFIYRAYEVYPREHPWAGKRRFKRVGLSVRKGLAKTEKEALIVFAELHPEAPVRCDGFDANGQPVGRPVASPYIPMLAVTVEQVEELAFGALTYIIENGPDADMFDVSQERIVRLDEDGRPDGKALPLANAPGSRDGARTTLNAFDEPHRLYLPRQIQAHNTMDANLPKRPLEDPWSLYVGTAGQPGQNSIAEQIHTEARMIADGQIQRPDLFYLYRTDDNPKRDMESKEERIRAIAEATGPAGEWGPGQFDDIASQWDRPGVDKPYLERVWLNRWVRSTSQAFDINKIKALRRPGTVLADGAFIGLGFDGARFRDSTGFVGTDMETGLQQLLAGWERPEDLPDEESWEIDEDEVTAALEDILDRFDVWKMYGDPPHWTETMGSWSVRWPDQVEEWWTARPKVMAYTLREFVELIDAGADSITFGGREDTEQLEDLVRHLGNAGRKDLKIFDDEGKPLWVLQKQDGRQDLKFDFAMAGVLSAKCRLDGIKADAKPRRKTRRAPRRLR